MPREVALVGAGIVGLGVVSRWAEMVKLGGNLEISEVDVFDRGAVFGPGMPYSAQFADDEHIANIMGRQVHFLHEGDFLEYRDTHKDEIRDYFYRRCQERFKEKFRNRFSVDYADESSLEGECSDEKRALKIHYDAIWRSFEKRYLNPDIGEIYHPRAVIGLYANFLFEESLRILEAHGIKVNRHTATEVSSIQEREDRVEVMFNGQVKAYDNVILAVGRNISCGPEIDSPRYVKSMWPSDQLVDSFRRLAQAEISKRVAAGNQDNVMDIGIIGSGLSAFDAMKCVLRDCVVINEDGSNTFSFEHNGFQVRCKMMSRSGIVPSVDGKSKYDVFVNPDNVPRNIAINKDVMRNIAKLNGGKHVKLWQAMLVVTRSLYVAYREGENPLGAAQAKDILQFLVSLIPQSAGLDHRMIIDETLKEAALDNVQFLDVITKILGLALDGFDYVAAIEKFSQMFIGDNPQEMLRRNVEDAEVGDVAGGFLVWRDIMAQLHLCGLKTFLSAEEMDIYESPRFNRLMQSWINAMPLQSAKYMRDACDAGILDIVALGEDYVVSVLDDGRIRYSVNDGEVYEFDVVVNASGYELDIRKHKSGILADMASRSEIALTPRGLIDKSKVAAESKVVFASDGASLAQAFSRGNSVALRLVESRPLQSSPELIQSALLP